MGKLMNRTEGLFIGESVMIKIELTRAAWGLLEFALKERIAQGEERVRFWKNKLFEAPGDSVAAMGLQESMSLQRLRQEALRDFKAQLHREEPQGRAHGNDIL
jgi:hypothetical protein